MKQRLVGTIVVGCLAIIFIPALLDGEGISSPAMTSSIPDSPPMPTVPTIEPVRPEITSDSITLTQSTPASPNDADIASQTDNSDEEAVQTSPPPVPDRPRLTSAGIPATWAVRLGSFGEAANAEALVSRLREKNYKGFSRPLNSSRGILTGVYVGPVLTESVAGNLQQELAKEFELEGAVVQFAIEELEQ